MSNAQIRKVRIFDDVFGNGEIPSPAGLMFIPNADVFLTVPDNSSKMTAVTSREEEVHAHISLSLPKTLQEINLAFDPKFSRILGLDSNGHRFIEIKADSKGNIIQSSQSRIDVKFLDINFPQGITIASDGTLYVLDSAAKKILSIKGNNDGSFEKSIVSSIPLPPAIDNPRGIAFNSSTKHLHIYSFSQRELWEISRQGEVITIRDLSNLRIREPGVFVFAPSGDLTDDPNQLSLYIADSAPNSGGIVELSLTENTKLPQTTSNAAITINPSLIQTIDPLKFSVSDFHQQGLTMSILLILCSSIPLKLIDLLRNKNCFYKQPLMKAFFRS